MRVAQKIAGYSLAEADLLRKAMGKKSREVIATERAKFVDGRRAHRLRRRARQAAVRHHRAVRRLRLQQEPRLRLRPRRLPDRLPQGALPGRVPGLPADERQEQPGEGRRLHLRVPHAGHPGADARHQPVGHRLRRAGARRGARRRRRCRSAAPARSRSGCRPCATSAPGWSPCCSRSATPTGRTTSFHDFAERVPEPVLNKRAVESLIKAGAFDSLGHCRKGLLGVFEHITDTTLTRRREREKGVMSLFGDWGGEAAADAAGGLRRAPADPRRRVRQDRQAAQREGDARAVRVRPPAVRRRRPRCAARSSSRSPTSPSCPTATTVAHRRRDHRA